MSIPFKGSIHMSNLSRLYSSASAAALLLALSAPSATAQSAAGAETVFVTATRTATTLTDVPASVSVITPQDIADSGAIELDDALRNVPGIDLMGYSSDSQHPTSNSLGMRGLGGGAQGISRALVMVDGIPINDAFFGYVQWNRVPLDNIGRVEIVRGGGSPLWGNYAEGGVINIVTQPYESDRLTVDASGGSYGTYRVGATGTYRLDDQNALDLFAGANGTSGYQQVPVYERTPFNVPSSSDAVNFHARDSFEGDGLTAHLGFDYHDNHQRLETLLDTNSQQNFTVSGDVARQFGADASLALTLFYEDSQLQHQQFHLFPRSVRLGRDDAKPQRNPPGPRPRHRRLSDLVGRARQHPQELHDRHGLAFHFRGRSHPAFRRAGFLAHLVQHDGRRRPIIPGRFRPGHHRARGCAGNRRQRPGAISAQQQRLRRQRGRVGCYSRQ